MKKIILTSLIIPFIFLGCVQEKQQTNVETVKKVEAIVKTQSNGLTVEQENIKKRLEAENIPGSVKHLYVISPYSGQVIIYSTAKGKVTSSGKRLEPYSVATIEGQYIYDKHNGMLTNIRGQEKYTSEVLQDDGTYGSSIPYLYWFDVNGKYHQHYVAGAEILHISDNPLPIKNVVINLEQVGETK